MPDIPGTGGSALPGTYSQVQTLSTGVSVTGGLRVTAIIGEGARPETIVAAARGGGSDGLDPTYTTTTGSDGRHFLLSQFPLISNRTQLFRNGIPLKVTEGSITSSTTFSNAFDVMVDTTTGHILMQAAHLIDLGGTFFTAASTNVGVGTINGLTLVDTSAPTEVWTIKCVSVQRNSLSQPIAGTAKFTAFGTVSGNVLDANGNIVFWIANNTTASNGILSFAIQETGSTPFREGDSFTIKVASGVLIKNDTLTAVYIPSANINNPTFFQTMTDIASNFGLASIDNNLTLGCQLAFANGSPGVMCEQAAPAQPRRTSYILSNSVDSTEPASDGYDFIFPLPPGVIPDLNSDIHFFVTDPTTRVETQIIPNKTAFYTVGTGGSNPTLSQFISSNISPPAGWSFNYSVIQQAESVAFGLDGYITLDYSLDGYAGGLFKSPSVAFDSSYVGLQLTIVDAQNSSNIATYSVVSVSNGDLFVEQTFPSPQFVQVLSGINFEVLDPFGDLVPGSSGTDGYIDATGHFGSLSVNFAALYSNPTVLEDGYSLKISGQPITNGEQPNNINGQFPITAVSPFNVTIVRSVITESNMRWEVVNQNLTGDYVVINHNVVPNGNALRVTIVDSRDATFFDSGWLNALAALETVECDILVPLPKVQISAIFQNALNHCLTMSNIINRKERVLFFGAINGLTPDNVLGNKLAAVEALTPPYEAVSPPNNPNINLANYSVSAAYGETFRAVYFYPDQIVVPAGTSNVIIDGFYMAAAAGGFESGTGNIALPLTQKVLTGFTILRNKQFSPFTLLQLQNAGITTLQPVSGGGVVVHGITTTQSGFIEEQEISIVFIRDRIAKAMRSGFQAFIGMPDDGNIIGKLSGRANSILSSFISGGLISAYKDLMVVRDSVDPTQFNLTVRVQPIYPVNYIFISISIGVI